MILNDGIARKLHGGHAQVRFRLIELAELEVDPAQAVEVGTVVGLELDCPRHECHGLLQLLRTV